MEHPKELRHVILSEQHVRQKMIQKSNIRCSKCWFDKSSQCICHMLPKLDAYQILDIDYIVYMDHNEYYNPGDDAKLILCTLPERSELYIYPCDDVKLRNRIQDMTHDNRKICVLFPNDHAISVEKFISIKSKNDVVMRSCDKVFDLNDNQHFMSQTTNQVISSSISHGESSGEPMMPLIEKQFDNIKEEISCDNITQTNNMFISDDNVKSNNERCAVIIVDAVWRRARKMASHLHKLFPDIPHVQLSPEQLSVYARKQTQPDRICSIEALALFLQCLGEDSRVYDGLTESVLMNNKSLKRKPNAAVVGKYYMKF